MDLIKKYGKLICIVTGTIVTAFIPAIVSSPYYFDIVIISMINAILAMSFLMMLRTGLINLGIGAFWGIGSYLSIIFVMKIKLSFWIGLPLSILTTALIAFFIGFIILRSGKGLTFILLSAVLGMIFSISIGNIGFLGGYSGVNKIPPPDPITLPFIPVIEFVSKIQFFYLAFTFLIFVTVICFLLYSCRTGRAWHAIGLNMHLAESIGINIFKYRLLVFVIASSVAGLAGIFYAHYQGFILPESFSMGTNINIQIYAVLGGIGFPILGPMLGSLLMTFLPEFLRNIEALSPLFEGALLVLLILFLPEGLLSLYNKLTTVIFRLKNNSNVKY